MTDLQETPAIFKLIRNRDVSVDAILLYLQHFPKSLEYPVHGTDTILTVAVKECYALHTLEAFENGEINALLQRQLTILSHVADFVSLNDLTSGQQSIFHLLLQWSVVSDSGDDDADELTRAVYKFISYSILEVLLRHVPVSDAATNILFVRNDECELAIHLAIMNENHRAARKLLEHMTRSCFEYSYYEYLEPDRKIPLLHLLLMHSPSSKILSSVFSVFPNAASMTDSDGVLPIAVALEHSISARKVEVIINKYPQALLIANDDGDLPLHLAAMDCPHEFEVLELLIDRYEIALITPNHNGQLPLHCCLEYQKNDHRGEPITLTTVQLLSNDNGITTGSSGGDNVESTRILDGDKLTDDSTTNTSLPTSPVSTLHSPTVSYFDDELDPSMRSPCAPDVRTSSALHHRDSYGELPLHSACRGLTVCAVEILSWFLERYPESASARNRFGHLPLHLLAAAEEHTAPDDTLEQCFDLLHSAYPCAIYTQDDEGDIPLHCLLTHCDVSPTLLDCFVKNMTRINEGNVSLMENPSTGHLPLHTACLNGVYSIKVLNQLISLYPEGLRHYDLEGRQPFHIALESPQHCNPSILKTLLYHTDRDTISVTGPLSTTTLPCTAQGIPALFVACEHAVAEEQTTPLDDHRPSSSECQVLDVIRFLVENSPELFIKRK